MHRRPIEGRHLVYFLDAFAISSSYGYVIHEIGGQWVQ